MKLVTAIVNKDDSNGVQSALTSNGFSVTRLATTGGFLMSGNVTFLIATDDEKVDRAIELIADKSQMRKELIPATTGYDGGMSSSVPIEVTVGGATIFVQDIERFEKV